MLIANFPGLDGHMADRYYKVLVGDGALTLDDLHNPVGQEEIKIVPVIVGAGGAVGQIIAGVALVALTLIPGGLPIAGTLATKIGLFGGALILGGVAQLVSPTPEIKQGPDTEQDPRKSFSFSGIQNTSRGGTPVPIVYGKTLTGSVVISAGIDTEQVQA